MRTLLTEPRLKTIAPTKPRLGFLGVSWIGRNRLEAVANSGVAEITAIADTSMKLADEAASVAPQAHVFSSLDELLETELDGLVIATPSALHAEQTIAALERGIAVFCQKPIGRNAAETRRVVEAARAANVLLGTDLSYRFVTGIRKIRELCRSGELGQVFAADLFFHSAYGPDKPWFYDAKLSGGGCLIDLGIHLADLGLWMLDFPQIAKVSGCLFAQGKPIRPVEQWRLEPHTSKSAGSQACASAKVPTANEAKERKTPADFQTDGSAKVVEDYAQAQIDLESGGTIRIACSWKLPAGCDAVIAGSFYGTKGGAAFHNVDGSFHDFTAEQFRGTERETIASPPDAWPGRAAVDWAQRLANGEKFDPEIEHVITVAKVLDSVYKHSCEEMDLKS